MPCKKSQRMADGGILLADARTQESPEETLARMNAKYGLGDNRKQAPQPTTQTSTTAPPQTPAKRTHKGIADGLLGKVIDAVMRRDAETRNASGYARGGIMPVIGAGTGTSDSVPAIVAGQEVRLSNGEGAAILPARTMNNKSAVRAIEAVIEATNGKPTATGDKRENKMSREGARTRNMSVGGVLYPQDDEKKLRMANDGVHTSAPTSQDGYPPAAGAAPVRSWWSGTDTRDGRTGLELEKARVAAGLGMADTFRDLNGPSMLTSAIVGDGKIPSPGMAQAPYSNEGRPSAISAGNSMDSSPRASGTGNAGDAQFNPGTGILSFSSKGFDPTRQQFAPGTGAITDPRTGRTMLLTGSEEGQATGLAAPAGATDAYGNSTARTDQMKAELAQMQQANGGTSAGPRVSMLQSLPAEEASRDRFDRFVRQSNADRIAHDLAIGGGSQRMNAGRIAALDAMTRGIGAQIAADSAQNIASMRAQSGIAEAAMAGNNRLAETAMQGGNALALERARQAAPVNALMARKAQGDIADAEAIRAVRNEIANAAPGNTAASDAARRKGIAYGLIRNERPPNEFAFTPSPFGGGHVIDKSTGSLMNIDAQGKATPVQMNQQTAFGKKDVDDALKAGADKEAVRARIAQMGRNPADYGL